MTIEQWTAVDRYITALLIDDIPAFDAADLPAISVSPPQGKLLHLIARMIGARRILEIGTLAGYSAIWMARALPPDGRLITLEVDQHHAEVARKNIARAKLSDCVEVRVGPALDTLPKLEGPFDLTFIDADKANIPEYFSWAQRLSRKGGAIIVDNVVRNGAVIEENSSDPAVLGVRRLNDQLAQNDGVEATTIQTVGSKGYDGFTLAVVR